MNRSSRSVDQRSFFDLDIASRFPRPASLAFAGSRNAEMMRAAIASSMVRSGISDPPKGRGTSKPSPFLRGIKWMWK